MTAGFVPTTAAPRRDADALTLPPRPAPPPRPAVPWLASAVPVVGALGFWAFTGSAFALWFAVLGPVIAVAGVADGQRSTRRERRTAAREAEAELARVRSAVVGRHRAERAALDLRHPGVAGYLARPEQIWRTGTGRDGAVVVGRGVVPSDVRITSSGSHPDDVEVVREAQSLADAPVAVVLGTGCAVVGPEALARGVLRSLVMQIALAHPPGDIEISGPESEAGWLRALPHAAVPGARRVVWAGSAAAAAADVVLVCARPGEPLPPRCDVVITVDSLVRARVEAGVESHDVAVEALGAAQATVIAADLAARRAASGADDTDSEPVLLRMLRPAGREHSRDRLAAAIGVTGGAPYEVDLVHDGPHAVVTGMTGSGKSELLVSWVVALCLRYTTADVTFLLADFKGGTSFETLGRLPHVTGVVTDLDARSAGRAIESLRSEIRHREAVLARAGARDVAGVDLPRLVVVVDEFAALRDAHPDLEPLFADIAARGRALGIHLILGTQRAGGVLRDGLLANCPLRISLRVAEPYDSTAVVGVPDAASLPGGAHGRGRALIRRSGDARPSCVRIALSGPADADDAARDAGAVPRATWLAELPRSVPLKDLRGLGQGLVLGLADRPESQAQEPLMLGPGERGLLVVGGPASGKTTALRTLAAQSPARLWVDADPERAWDALVAAALHPPAAGTAVFLDDVDALTGRFPDEYGRAAGDAVERLIRDAGSLGIRVFASAQRLTGPAGRIADLFGRRLILATPSRAEHVAAGGEARDFAPSAPPGRGVLDGTVVQVALAEDAPHAAQPAATALWHPPVGVSGYVARRGTLEALQRWERTGVRIRAVDAADDPAATEPGGRVVIVGDPEQWLARPRLLERVRGASTLVVDAACGRDLRLLTGERDLPPYVKPVPGRAWEFAAGAAPRRVAVAPSGDS